MRLVSAQPRPGESSAPSNSVCTDAPAARPSSDRSSGSASPKPTSSTASRPTISPTTAAVVQRQAFAGLLWSKQFYHFVVQQWLDGDPAFPPPPAAAQGADATAPGSTSTTTTSFPCPDKWEYPWFAAWDLAFHMIPLALVDPDYAKDQLARFLREWYMSPNGQLPAYEWEFSDVNPPVHAWSCWRVFKIDWKLRGQPDYEFLEAAFTSCS